jgi:protein phosphatase
MSFLRRFFGGARNEKQRSDISAPATLAPDATRHFGSTPEVSQAPAELEEQSELLTVTAAALENKTEILAPDGTRFRIENFLEARGAINSYTATQVSAVVEKSAEKIVRLREANRENAALLEREFAVRSAMEESFFNGSTPGLPLLFYNANKTFLADALPQNAPTLAELFAENAPLETTLPVLLAAAQTAAKMHARGWMHGGLRPEIICAASAPFADFSSALPASEKLEMPISHGEFSAPELAQPGAVADARADVFSLGALFYRALAGAPLSQIENDEGLQRRVFTISGVPQILSRSLGASEARYQNAAEFHDALSRWSARRAPLREYSSAVASVIGLNPTRAANEDAALFLSGGAHSEWGQTRWALIAVADGMGGMDAGEAASRAAMRSLAQNAAALAILDELPDENIQARWTKEWAHNAAAGVAREMQSQNARGGCTLVFALMFENRISLAHAGDCRAYVFDVNSDHWEILTRDHSYVATLWQAGEIAWEELRTHPERNQITRALGEKEIMPDWFFDSLEIAHGKKTCELAPGEVLLLASDGAWEPVSENEMAQIIRLHFPDLSAAANAISKLALERGAPDNATVALLMTNDER